MKSKTCKQSMLPVAIALVTVMAVSSSSTISEAQGPPDNRSPKTILLTSKLFMAIDNNDDVAFKAALKSGSDPNGRNWLGFTPLMWASVRGRESQADYLLSHGAKLNDVSPYGSALTFSLNGRHKELALHLISKGAITHPSRVDGETPMMYAAADGYPDVITTLSQHHENVNAKDIEGDTALIYASKNGNASAVKALIALGATVNTADRRGRTALMEAAVNGRAEACEALLAAHADIEMKDKSGCTAILLAGRYSSEPGVIDVLMSHGAHPKARDSHGNTPLSLAISRGHSETAARLRRVAIGVPASAQAGQNPDVHVAIETSITAIEGGMKRFGELARCNACHHQGLGLQTLGVAADSGIKVNGQLIGSYMKSLGDEGKAGGPAIHNALAHPELIGTIQAVDIGDMPIGAGYMFGAMLAHHVPANPGLAETAQLVASLQKPDGRWVYGMDREPMQGSQVTTTALVVQVLKAYGSQEPSAHIAERIERAKLWLLKSNPSDSEGRAMRLLGLKWAGASETDCAAAAKDLVALQHGDGGWAQLPAMATDAYATGISLYALKVGGSLQSNNSHITQGVNYLMRTQDEDGSWFVNKRTNASNNYFDAGFPGGESQYTSFAATCWATMALIKATQTTRDTASR